MIGQTLKEAVERGASDIILAPNNYPSLKVNGEVQFLSQMWMLNKGELDQEILAIIPEKMKKAFADELELDFGITLK